MTDDNQAGDEDVSLSEISEAPDGMTEQIDASFGPMNVYVSGTDQEDVLETFNEVWETMLDTSDTMHERKQDMDDGGENRSSRTYGD